MYKLKKDSNGNVVNYKARLVAKGYVEWKEVDFKEVFASVAKLDTVSVILALAANRDWEVHHMNVKSPFLNFFLEEEVYVTQPKGFSVKNKEQLVYKLLKALYGLRQELRVWNTQLDKSLRYLRFKRCSQKQAVYTRGEKQDVVIIGIYVDDLTVTGKSTEEIKSIKKQ